MEIIRNSENIDAFKLIEQRAIHIICPASAGFTVLDAYSNRFITKENIYKFVDLTNSKNEVGTLFPRTTITAFPVPEWNSRNNKFDPKFYRKHLIDIFELHNKHIRLDKMLFIFNAYGYHFDKDIAIEQLEDLIISKNHFVHTKQIFIDEQ